MGLAHVRHIGITVLLLLEYEIMGLVHIAYLGLLKPRCQKIVVRTRWRLERNPDVVYLLTNWLRMVLYTHTCICLGSK